MQCMAAPRKETPPKSFFSSPSHALKKIVYGTVGGFPKARTRQVVQDAEPSRDVVSELPTFEAEALEDEDESSADDEANTIYSYSSNEDYPRPRIREDLLPHDFSEWQKSPCPSVAPSTASEASSTSKEAESFSEVLSTSTSGISLERRSSTGRPKPFRVPHSTDLRDVAFTCDDRGVAPHHLSNSAGLEPKGNGHVSRGNVIASFDGEEYLRSLSENRQGWVSGGTRGEMGSVDSWNGVSGSAAAGGQLRQVMLELAGTRDGGKIDMGLYQNLIEMFPLIETFVEHPEYRQRRKFQHHASMVYTRAPDRNSNVKKIAVGAKNIRNHGRANGKNESVWEDREADGSSPYEDGESSAEVAKLQCEVEELQRKLAKRDAQLAATVVHENSQAKALARKLENLQNELATKERLWETAREKLVQKEDEINGMERLLRKTEENYAGLRERSASSEEEVRSLRCEVAALRWQVEVDESKKAQLENLSIHPGSVQKTRDIAMGQCDAATEKQQQEDLEEMETARKMYLAAIVAAKHIPVEECLALVGEMRMQLQSFLRRSTFHGGNDFVQLVA